MAVTAVHPFETCSTSLQRRTSRIRLGHTIAISTSPPTGRSDPTTARHHPAASRIADFVLGVVVETLDGERDAALVSTPERNNVAEYRALHLGLDVLASRAPPNARVGFLIDHDRSRPTSTPRSLPRTARLRPATTLRRFRRRQGCTGAAFRHASMGSARSVRVADSGDEPRSATGYAPDQYATLRRAGRCVLPARADRGRTSSTAVTRDVTGRRLTGTRCNARRHRTSLAARRAVVTPRDARFVLEISHTTAF